MTQTQKLREEFKLLTANFGPRERVATRWLYHCEPFGEVVSMFHLTLEEQEVIFEASCYLHKAQADHDRVYEWSNALGDVKL